MTKRAYDLASSDRDWLVGELSLRFKKAQMGGQTIPPIALSRFMPAEYSKSESHSVTLEDETRTIIEETRMVLPGIQALFGFQLIAVFNESFSRLAPAEQRLHLGALLSVVLAVALIMTPASYHRIAEKGTVSRRFVEIASRLLAIAMLPLVAGITVDLFVVARLILKDVTLSAAIATLAVILFVGLWYVFPWAKRT
jgi:hypothetical protein